MGVTVAMGASVLTAVVAAILLRAGTVAYSILMTGHLAYTIRRDADYPSSPELHERLETIETLSRRGRSPSARERVRHELADLRISALLSNGDASIERALNPLLRPMNLPYIGLLAAKARARNPRKQGRRKFYPDPGSGPDALEYCALIVSVAWQKDTGDWPGYGNPTAQFICELLWRRAGGKPHELHSGFDAPGTFATWRKHLAAARRYYPPHAAGKLVTLILAGDPSKRRLQPTGAQSRRWRAFYDHPTRVRQVTHRKRTRSAPPPIATRPH
jgi:hypothetical protein